MSLKKLIFSRQRQASKPSTSTKEVSKIRRLANFVKDKARPSNKQAQIVKSKDTDANSSQVLLREAGVAVQDFAPVTIDVGANININSTTDDSFPHHDIAAPQCTVDGAIPEVSKALIQGHTASPPVWETLVNTICTISSDLNGGSLEASPTTLVGHSRQSSTSTSITLPVSLERRASEPCLRRKQVEWSDNLQGVKSLDDGLTRLQELRAERTLDLVLQNNETAHVHEIAALQDEHEDELKDVRRDMQKTVDEAYQEVEKLQRRKVFLQKELKKENLNKRECQQALRWNEEQAVVQGDRDTALTNENARLLDVMSDIQAREDDYRRQIETLTAKVRRDRRRLEEFINEVHGEWNDAYNKNAQLNFVIEGTPTADMVDQKGLIDYKTHQIQVLENDVREAAIYVDQLETAADSHKRECSREIERLTANLQHSQSAESELRKRFDRIQGDSNALASLMERNLSQSDDIEKKAIGTIMERLHDDAVVLQEARVVAAQAQAAAEKDVRTWRYQYENLQGELIVKNEEIERLTTVNRQLDSDACRLDIELNVTTINRDADINARDQQIEVLREHINLLMGHIDAVQAQGASNIYDSMENNENEHRPGWGLDSDEVDNFSVASERSLAKRDVELVAGREFAAVVQHQLADVVLEGGPVSSTPEVLLDIMEAEAAGRVIRRVRKQRDLYTLYRKTAEKGKGRVGESCAVPDLPECIMAPDRGISGLYEDLRSQMGLEMWRSDLSPQDVVDYSPLPSAHPSQFDGRDSYNDSDIF